METTATKPTARVWIVGACLLGGVVLGACARPENHATRVDALEREVAALAASLAQSRAEVEALRPEVATTTVPPSVPTPTAPAQRVRPAVPIGPAEDLDSLLRELFSDHASARRITGGHFGRLLREFEDLADCINEYMDTVARAGSGRYTYYHC